MIRYALRCVPGRHGFEGWFRSSVDFEAQVGRDLVSCPRCSSTSVEKAPMAPSLGGRTSEGEEEGLAAHVMPEDVGDAFARTATDMHEGRIERRPVYGKATGRERAEMREAGVPHRPFAPPHKRDLN